MPGTRQAAGALRSPLSPRWRRPMADDEKPDYEVGYGKPPLHTRFKKGQSGNLRGRPRGAKNLTTLVSDALDQLVVVTENGRRREISKRYLGIAQLVNKFAMADLHATRILLGMLLDGERCASSAPDEQPTLGAADKLVIENLLK